MAYSIETVGPSRRSLTGNLVSVYYALGYMSSSALAYLIPDWRGFTLSTGILTAVAIGLSWFYPESAPFLYSRNNFKKGRKVIQKFAANTDVVLTNDDLDKFEKKLHAELDAALVEVEKKTFSWIDLFRSWQLTKITLILSIAFMVRYSFKIFFKYEIYHIDNS